MSLASITAGTILLAACVGAEGWWLRARASRDRVDPPLAISHDGLRWRFAAGPAGIPFVFLLLPGISATFLVALVWACFWLLLMVARRAGLRRIEFELLADACGLTVRRSNHPFSLPWAAIDRVGVDGTRLAIASRGASFDVYVARSMIGDLPRVAEWLEAARRSASEAPAPEPVPADLEQFVARSRASTAGA